MFALVDCNNFYVSCERAFNPRIENKPVVILSNNDGCIISRSNEAKKIGIPMGAPFFQWEKFCKKNHVQVFSSNYELYGDMSQRVMMLLREFWDNIEIYSIDEAFLFFQDVNEKEYLQHMQALRQKIKMCTGIPISIGIAPTKTLAKIANIIAKNQKLNVCSLCDVDTREYELTRFPIERIWGVGRKLSVRLKEFNLHTAKNLRDADSKWLRAHFSVVLEKVIHELRGISCLSLESIQPRKQIISSRSFGKLVTELSEIEEAVSHYAAVASLKLRKQKSLTAGVYVYLETNMHVNHWTTISFANPTDNTSDLIGSVKKGAQHIFRKGSQYRKAGIILLDLQSNAIKQQDMFTDNANTKSESLTDIVDSINNTLGKNAIFYCAEGIKRTWQMKCSKRSPRYTTNWEELLRV